jgi:hypothetical protein
VKRDASPTACAAVRRGDLDRSRPERQEAEQCGAVAMAQHCAGATRKDCSHEASPWRQERVPDGVHPGVYAMQALPRKSVLDRLRADTGVQELSPPHHTVLARGERRDLPIEREPVAVAACIRAPMAVRLHDTGEDCAAGVTAPEGDVASASWKCDELRATRACALVRAPRRMGRGSHATAAGWPNGCGGTTRACNGSVAECSANA